ncbi:hypothetical protein WJX73_004545, partial [Symbiochloris irregularis]
MGDVTRPGSASARTKALQQNEELGAAPLMWNPLYNQGTCWSVDQRKAKNLEGLVPPVAETLEQAADRVMMQIREEPTGLARYELLNELTAHNVTLFYWVLVHNLVELAPYVYTPVVGEACQKFDQIFRTALGMYLDAFNHKGRIRARAGQLVVAH